MSLTLIGRWIVLAGAVLAVCGLLLIVADRIGLKLGRLPGDLALRRGHATLYAPIATSLLISVVLTVLLNIILARWRR